MDSSRIVDAVERPERARMIENATMMPIPRKWYMRIPAARGCVQLAPLRRGGKKMIPLASRGAYPLASFSRCRCHLDELNALL